MATEADITDVLPTKSKIPLTVGLVLALVGAGGGFYATWSGMILGDTDATHTENTNEDVNNFAANFAFVEVDAMVISIDSKPVRRLLRFRAQLEVPKMYQDEVTTLMPRVVDVLNSYLRALEVSDLEDQAALARLRAQMLRRVQIVTGTGRVNDFLIMEFVLT